MKYVVVGFSRPKKWKAFAKAIMWWDGSDISHAYIRFRSDRWDSDFIYQAANHRTHFIGGIYFSTINQIVEEYMFEVDDKVEASVGRLCVDREGKPYAIKQVIGASLVNLLFLFSFGKIRLKKNPFANGDDETVCIEEVSEILKRGLGVENSFDMDMLSVKPFRDWIRSLPQAKKLV
jgi:hypothetical protein